MNSILILFSILGFSFFPAETRLYEIQFKSLDKARIDMSAYKGKKVIIVAFNAVNPDYTQLRSLDTIYQRHKNHVVIIAIPIEEFGKAMPDKNLINLLRDTMNVNYPIAAVSKAHKKQDKEHHPLLQWLTNKSMNGHFDEDVEGNGQMFIINETGILYAVVKQKILPTGKMMMEIVGRYVKE